ncbi:unnamed protein product [Ilex paraguariensis]
MVDNPETNSIISWSPTGTSLIIWDLIKFSELLPIYFKHNHFSSFNYQLNNYGFRKISWDKWEYENPLFQEGKKHLLGNIQRKNKQVSVTKKQQVAKNRCFDSGEEFRVKDKLENVRNDNMKLRVEIQNLKLQQENMENQFAALEEHMADMEFKQQKMIIFIANKFNPSFFQRFIHQLRRKMEIDSTQTAKKRKLVVPQSTENSMEPMDMDAMDTTLISQNIDGENQVQHDFTTIQSESQTAVSSADKLGSPIQNQKANATSDINAEDYPCWNKLLEDDSMCENELERELRLAHSKMVMEFEDLIEKPSVCGVEEEGNLDLWS